MNYNLDKIDFKILKTLQANAKITNLQLSAEIGLSPAPTLERVKKLENANLIKGYFTEVNEEALGKELKPLSKLHLHVKSKTQFPILKRKSIKFLKLWNAIRLPAMPIIF